MTEKTTYIAFDGVEFEFEDECLEYENTCHYYKSLTNAHFYNFHGQEIAPNDLVYNIECVYIALLPTMEAVEGFKEIERNLGYEEVDEITKPGFYFYEELEEKSWHKVEEFPQFVANTFEIYNTAKQIKERLENEN